MIWALIIVYVAGAYASRWLIGAICPEKYSNTWANHTIVITLWIPIVYCALIKSWWMRIKS